MEKLAVQASPRGLREPSQRISKHFGSLQIWPGWAEQFQKRRVWPGRFRNRRRFPELLPSSPTQGAGEETPETAPKKKSRLHPCFNRLGRCRRENLGSLNCRILLGKSQLACFQLLSAPRKKRARVLCFFVWRQLYDWVLEIETITGVKTAFLDLSQAARCLDLKF